jgi:DnaK suppressor protein
MTPARLAHFKRKLEALERELRTDLEGGTAADESIAPDNAIGRLTRMEAIQAQAMGQAGQRRMEQRLQRVRRALERVAEGSYGSCPRCGGEIPEGRLEIMPESGLCVTCAARSA